MPAVSRRQQRYLAWRFGGQWLKLHHFDVVDPKAKKPKKK